MRTVTDIITGLRAMADFIEANQDVMVDPHRFSIQCGYSCDKDVLQRVIKRGGAWAKNPTGHYMFATRTLAEGVDFWLACDRDQVCERIVVGTEVIPAQPERVVEKVEWHCTDPLLAPEPVLEEQAVRR